MFYKQKEKVFNLENLCVIICVSLCRKSLWTLCGNQIFPSGAAKKGVNRVP